MEARLDKFSIRVISVSELGERAKHSASLLITTELRSSSRKLKSDGARVR